jgi:transcriptional regulator with XRE-family HTH domain
MSLPERVGFYLASSMTFHAIPFRGNTLNNELELIVKRPLQVVPESDWKWRSEAAAIASMIARSGLQEKTIAIECGIDASTLAKVKQGTARPSEEHLNAMMDATGYEAWLFYWIIKRGYDPRSLRRFESDVERENRELRERMAAMEAEREVELRLYRQLRAAA